MTPLQLISKDLVHYAEELSGNTRWLENYAKALHLKSLEDGWVTEGEEGIRASVETYLKEAEKIVGSLNLHFNDYLSLLKEPIEEEQ